MQGLCSDNNMVHLQDIPSRPWRRQSAAGKLCERLWITLKVSSLRRLITYVEESFCRSCNDRLEALVCSLQGVALSLLGKAPHAVDAANAADACQLVEVKQTVAELSSDSVTHTLQS